MLCTRCSEHVRPIVAIDIDGTLGDYHSHFLKFAEAYMGTQPGYVPPSLKYTGGDGFRHWFNSMYATSNDEWHDIKLAYRQGGQKRTMPVYPYAAEFVNGLYSEGAEVWLTTTRPYLRLDSVDPDTREWLRRNGIQFHHLLYDDHKYSKLESMVDAARVVGILDDLTEEWWEAEAEFGRDCPLFRRNIYNGDAIKELPEDAYVTSDLHEAAALLGDRVKNFNVRTAERRLA